MNIFIREWKRNRKSLIIWSISIGLLIFFIMAIYPSFADSQANLEEFLKAYPEGFLTAFGMDRLNLTDILGFFGMEGYLMLTLFGGIYAMLLAANMIAKEENEKTIEFLLAKPVTRNEILTSKILLVFFNILLFNLVMLMVTFVSFEAYKLEDYDLGTFIILMVGPFLLQITFASIGLLLSVFINKAKTVYPISIGIVLATYFFNVIANLSDKLEALKYLSPFKYVDAPDIILNGKIEVLYLTIIAITIVVSIALTYFYYNKKDITV